MAQVGLRWNVRAIRSIRAQASFSSDHPDHLFRSDRCAARSQTTALREERQEAIALHWFVMCFAGGGHKGNKGRAQASFSSDHPDHLFRSDRCAARSQTTALREERQEAIALHWFVMCFAGGGHKGNKGRAQASFSSDHPDHLFRSDRCAARSQTTALREERQEAIALHWFVMCFAGGGHKGNKGRAQASFSSDHPDHLDHLDHLLLITPPRSLLTNEP